MLILYPHPGDIISWGRGLPEHPTWSPESASSIRIAETRSVLVTALSPASCSVLREVFVD